MVAAINSIDDLAGAPYNPRKIGKAAATGLGASISRFGDIAGIVFNATTGRLVCGHQRVEQLRKLGAQVFHEGGKPVVRVGKTGERFAVRVVEWDEAQEKAANVAANNPHIGGEFTDELQALLGEVQCSLGEDAFEELQLDALLEPDRTPADEDEAPEPPAEPVTKPGDLWVLGEHRLYCGDATDKIAHDAVMLGARADLCMTDPPYGADIQYNSHNDTQDALSGLIAGFMPLAKASCDVVALTPGINNMWKYQTPDWVLCWFYGAGTGRTPWGFTSWQPVLVWGKCPKLGHGEGCHPDGFQFMMSKSDAAENKTIAHACPKPLSVWTRFIERLTHKGTKRVYEPFSGSGTTIVASERLGLICGAIELDPAYCDVAVERWEQYTGGKAKRGNA